MPTECHLSHCVEGSISIHSSETRDCMCDQGFGRRIPFAFLEDVRERYLTRFSDSAQSAPAYAHNAEFSKVLEERMEYYSTDEKADTINRVRGGISEVKNVMIENIDKVRSAAGLAEKIFSTMFSTSFSTLPSQGRADPFMIEGRRDMTFVYPYLQLATLELIGVALRRCWTEGRE